MVLSWSASLFYILQIFCGFFFTLVGYRYLDASKIIVISMLMTYIGFALGDDLPAAQFVLGLGFMICSVGLLKKYHERINAMLVFGIVLGFQMGSILNIMFFHFFSDDPNLPAHILMPLLALAVGAGCRYADKVTSISIISFVGSYILLEGMGYFIGGFPATFVPFAATRYVSPKYYVYFVYVILLSIISGLFQYFLSAKDFDHTVPEVELPEHTDKVIQGESAPFKLVVDDN